MGGEPTTWGSLSWRNPDSTSFWERYPATTSAVVQWSWSVTRRRLPKILISRALRTAGSMCQVRRIVAGVVPVSWGVSTLASQRGWVMGSKLVLAAGLAPGQSRGELAQVPGGLGEGLVEAGALFGVQVGGVGQDDPPVGAEHERAGVVGAEPWVLVGVDGVPAAGGDGEQVGEAAWWQRPDVVHAGAGEVGEVRGTVLSGVEHHRRAPVGPRSNDGHGR